MFVITLSQGEDKTEMCRSKKFMSQTEGQRNEYFPTCESDMIAVEHKEIELDYRPKCQGIWLDVCLKIEEVMR